MVISAVACGAVLLLLLFQIFVSDTRYVDFRYIWYAGKFWGEGFTPYGAAYAARAKSDFPEWDFPLLLWIYPPCWYPLSIVFAQLPVGLAHRIGSIVSLLATIMGSWSIWRALQVRAPRPEWVFVAILALILIATPTTAMVRQAAPTFVAQFGLALVIAALLRPNQLLMAVGIALSMFKPQIGLPACAALVFVQGSWRPLVIAALCDIALSVPAFMLQSPLNMAHAIAGLSQDYATVAINTPVMMTGIGFFLAQAGFDLATGPSIVAAMLLSATVALITRYRFVDDPDTARRICAFAVPCIISGIVSMHPYDHVAILMVMPLVLRFGWKKTVFCGICYLLIWRSENLARVFNLGIENAVGILSVGTIGLMLVALFNVSGRHDPATVRIP
jgi:drug/metabolite transporter superfamily protein YnfA